MRPSWWVVILQSSEYRLDDEHAATATTVVAAAAAAAAACSKQQGATANRIQDAVLPPDSACHVMWGMMHIGQRVDVSAIRDRKRVEEEEEEEAAERRTMCVRSWTRQCVRIDARRVVGPRSRRGRYGGIKLNGRTYRIAHQYIYRRNGVPCNYVQCKLRLIVQYQTELHSSYFTNPGVDLKVQFH